MWDPKTNTQRMYLILTCRCISLLFLLYKGTDDGLVS